MAQRDVWRAWYESLAVPGPAAHPRQSSGKSCRAAASRALPSFAQALTPTPCSYKRNFFVNTRETPPRSIWVHPLDEPGAAQPSSSFAPPGAPPPGHDVRGDGGYPQQGYGQPQMGYGQPQMGYGQQPMYAQQPMQQSRMGGGMFGGGGGGGRRMGGGGMGSECGVRRSTSRPELTGPLSAAHGGCRYGS